MQVIYMFTIKRFIPVFVVLIITGQLYAQFSSWVGIGINKSLGKHFGLEGSYEYRFKNTNQFDKSNFEIKINQNWVKGLETFVRYRNSMENNKYSGLNSRIYAYNNRFSFGLDVSFLRLIDFSKRTKLNWTITQQLDNYQFRRNSSILRNRLMVKHDIKDFFLSPFFSLEHFYKWNRDIIYSDDEIIILGGTNAIRYFIGTDVEINKTQKISASFGFRELFLKNKSTSIFRIN
ncbi:MAG: DUF2490 domain-containing protein, partial [Bacteroidota bacterium]